MTDLFTLIFGLLVAHALCDFSLQTSAMATGKNRNRKLGYIPHGQKYVPCWPFWLSAHALISGGGVWMATGNVVLGATETVLHWLIDFAKCENWTNPYGDQALHLLCRVWYVVVVLL